MSHFRIGFACLWAVLLAGSVAAQTTAVISGVVTDTSGGVMPGVTVTATNVETGIGRTEVTDAEGRYRVRELGLGSYEVRAELAGFSTIVRRGIELTMGREAVLDLSMAVGGLEQQIIVTGDAPLVDVRSGSVAGLVTEDVIKELPLAGRDLQQLLTLEVGVTQMRTSSGGAQGGFGKRMSVGGARPDMTGWLLDGTDVQTTFRMGPAGASGVQLGVDAMQEFRVMTSSYPAEFGGAGGGVVTAVTKAGTNSIHGTVFEFFRNDKMEQPNYFSIGVPPLNRNQFGGSMGGPLVKNKMFFFGAYERLAQTRGETKYALVPTALARQGILPGRAPITVDPFTAQLIELVYPLPNGQDFGTGVAEYTSTTDYPLGEHYGTGRLDYTVNNSHTLFARVTADNVQNTTRDLLNVFETDVVSKRLNGTGEHTWVMGAKWLSKARIGFNKGYDASTYHALLPNVDLLKVSGTQFPAGFDPREVSIFGIGGGGGEPPLFNMKHVEFGDDVSFSSGAHNVKFGGNVRHIMFDEDVMYWSGGAFIYTGLATFLQGTASSLRANMPGSTGARRFRQNVIAVYAQDSWLVSQRLSVDGGVRYEFITVPREIEGREGWIRFPMDTKPTMGAPFANPSLKNVAPRLGVAWNVRGDGKTSLRGGIGAFHDQLIPAYYQFPSVNSPPYVSRGEVNNVLASSAYSQLVAGVNAGTTGLDISSIAYDMKNPLMLQYNLTMQHQLTSTLAAQVGYIGSRGRHLMITGEANSAIPTIQADGSKFFPTGLTRRNPAFTGNRRFDAVGKSTYHALVVGVTQRLSGGLQFGGAYTRGNSLDHNSATVTAILNGEFSTIDPEDVDRNWGPSLYDVKHNLVMNTMWTVPGFKNGGVLGAVVGGWQVAGVLTFQTGLSITPSLGFNRSRNLATQNLFEVPNLKAGYSANPVVDTRDPDNYLDVNAFELAPAGTYGNVKRDSVRGGGVELFDASLSKSVKLGGQRSLQLRLEGFNLLNRANFGLPDVRRKIVSANDVPNPASARIRSTSSTARQLQLGVKLLF